MSAGGPVDHPPHGRIFGADGGVGSDQRPQPVGKVDDIRPGDAREEILVAARKADHLVGEDRAAHQHVVVVQQQPVEAHGHALHQQPIAEPADLLGRDDAQVDQRLRIVPGVVEQAHGGVGGGLFFSGDAHQLELGFLAHGRVGAGGDHEIQLAHTPLQQSHDAGEEQRQRKGARAVGDQHQQALAVQRHARQAVHQDRFNFCLVEIAMGQSKTGQGHKGYLEGRVVSFQALSC